MAIGSLDSIPEGTVFDDRRQLYEAEVHRALQAGIVGSQRTGAESIVISGGYVDDADYGGEIIYTGHGGRDPATGRQVADQEFTRQNQALVRSCPEGLPVRVVRGADPRSAHAPDHGYRYDGVYWVDSYWYQPGADGFMVCRFRLVKEPELRGDVAADAVDGGAPASAAPRVEATILRAIRDTELGRRVKQMYDFSCQICRTRLDCAGGPYAEAAHVRPLGRPHNGPDSLENLLCLCPNHHVLLDNGAFTINDDFSFSGLNGRLAIVPGYSVRPAHLAYRRRMWQQD